MIFSIPVWVTFITIEKGISLQNIGILLAVSYLVSIIMELPSGIIADMYGRKNSIMIGYGLWVLTSFLPIVWNTFPQFMIIYILRGFYQAFVSGAEEALIYDELKQQRMVEKYHEVSLVRGKLLQYGIVIGTFAGGILYTIKPELPFVIEIVMGCIALVLISKIKEPKIDSVKYSLNSYIAKLQSGIKEITKNSYILSFSIFYALVGGITFAFQIYFNQALLVSFGFSVFVISLIFGTLRIINITTIGKIMKNSRIFTFKNSLLFFPIVMILAYLPGIWLVKWAVIIAVMLAMMASTARFIFLSKYLNDEVASEHRATAISVVNLLVSIIFSIVTFISSTLPNPQITFTGLGIVTLLVVLPLAVYTLKLSFSR